MTRKWAVLAVIFLAITGNIWASTSDTSPPESTVKLIFIHHSTGQNWLADGNGNLGIELSNNNYFVSDTNYGWGPDSIGDTTDIGHWYTWFRGPRSSAYMPALYMFSSQSCPYSRMASNPGGENTVVMFKSCFPNSALRGNATDGPTTGENPLRGQDAYSEYHTVANAKGIYTDLLNYFATQQDKLFVAITAPPLVRQDTNPTEAANAKAFNSWLKNDWLRDYPYDNVGVFDFFSVLANENGMAAYPVSPQDSHPNSTGNQLATAAFIPELNSMVNQWQGSSGPQPVSATYQLYFPHIATVEAWDTEVCVINATDQTLSGTLEAYSDAGVLISSRTVTLNGNGRQQFDVGTDFTNPDSIGYMIFKTDDSGASGYTKFYVSGSYRVAVPAVSDINSGDIFASHIASGDGWWTGASLVNTTTESKTVTIDFDSGESRTVTLGPMEHKAFTIDSLFTARAQPQIGSGVITNASGVIGLELFGNASQLSGVLLKDTTASTLYYPHIADDGEWWTGIVVYNPSAAQCRITLTPYDAAGNELTASTIDLDPGEKLVGLASALNLPQGTAWIKISAQTPVTGFELFGRTNQLAGYTSVGIAGESGIFPKIEKNGWTGIAFVNTSNSTASIILTAFDDSGTAIDTETIALAAHAKTVDLAENLFTSDISAATYISYSSDLVLVGFQLNGSSDGMMLDALPAIGDRESMALTSSAFSNMTAIPARHTSDGINVSPALSWSGVPQGTQSFVLIMDDPDAVPVAGYVWDHWIVYDIPASQTSIAENAGAAMGANLPPGASHGENSFQNTYYQGPSPPTGTGVHHYYFKLYALDVESLNPSGTTKGAIESAMTGHILATAQLVGTYTRD